MPEQTWCLLNTVNEKGREGEAGSLGSGMELTVPPSGVVAEEEAVFGWRG